MLLYSVSMHGYLLKGTAPHPYAMPWVLPFLKKLPHAEENPQFFPFPRPFCPKFHLWNTDGCNGFRWPVSTAVVCGCRVLPRTYREPFTGCCRYCCKRTWGCKTAHFVQSEKQMRISAFGYYQHQMEVREKTISRTPPMHQRSQERLMNWLVLPHDFLKV